MIGKYKLPYCPDCKLIWSKESVGRVFNCTICGRPLILKSFSPWPGVIIGIVIACLSIPLVLIQDIPPIWIGGVVFGGAYILVSILKWLKLKKMGRKPVRPFQRKPKKWKANHMIITCGNCHKPSSIEKGQGVIRIRCPHCGSEYVVKT